jgi:serine/threonine protein kinase
LIPISLNLASGIRAMTYKHGQTKEEVYSQASRIESPYDRAAYLEAACIGDAGLYREVEAMLTATGSVLESQAIIPTRPQPAVPNDLDRVLELSAMAERPGKTVAGRYTLLAQIGEGGMGTVWVADQSTPVQRRVALKLIKPGLDSREVIGRFNAERQALAMMDHPGIAKVFDGGVTDEGRPYFAMEFVKGIPITSYCKEAQLLLVERLHLFIQVCNAVQHAHKKGVIHRDLKPSNILVSLFDGQAVPKVIDFGLAKAMHHKLTDNTIYTVHGTTMGTPAYMSPEQAAVNNLDVDTRSDVYSLGVILYELLADTTPLEMSRFKNIAWYEIQRLIKEEDPIKPSLKIGMNGNLGTLAANRGLTPRDYSRVIKGDLDWIVMKALEKERSRRYETASALAADVMRYLGGDPVEAAPPSIRYRLSRFLKRHQGPMAAVLCVVVALTLGMAGTTWAILRAEKWRKRADHAEALLAQAGIPVFLASAGEIPTNASTSSSVSQISGAARHGRSRSEVGELAVTMATVILGACCFFVLAAIGRSYLARWLN